MRATREDPRSRDRRRTADRLCSFRGAPVFATEAAIISKYLGAFICALSGPYTATMTGGQVPHVRLVIQVTPEVREDVICDFSTDPPGYLTSGGHRLGNADARAEAALALALARLFHDTAK
jgi:hypothetical protein